MAAGFELIERLGSGHFGEVWLAREVGLDAFLALKVVPRDRLFNPKNFFQEAQILKAAEHPNVVSVRETGFHDDGSIYVAMEYLENGSLDDEAKGTYVPLTRVKKLMIDVLRGLEHAHEKNILHRDIKPANILVGAASDGKLSDFGLALPVGLKPSNLGIKDYKYVLHLAPEVAAGGDYTVAADIYACGVTMYRLLNGDSFFTLPAGADVFDLAARGKFPDRTHFREFIPRPWRSLVNKAMRVEPRKRFRSAEEMRHAVESMKAHMNWQERLLTDGVEWSSGHAKRCFHVARRKSPTGSWTVEVRKGPSRQALRRVGPLCSAFQSEDTARRTTQRILQDFVLGRLR